MMQEENHIFQGMRRDNHEIKQDSKFLWDAHNIRLTNRDDNTLFSITNERGTSNPLLTLQGSYVGHCTVGDFLIVFTAKEDKSNNYIYRIEKTDEGFKTIILFHEPEVWDKGWSPEHPIEALGYYETNLVQKVYWVDGVNQPRVINVAKPELKLPNECILDGVNFSRTYKKDNVNCYYLEDREVDKKIEKILESNPGKTLYNTNSFDFVKELQLQDIINVEKIYGEGEFTPGTIQYAISYFNKYEQESNISCVTPLYYASPKDRGGSPEEKVSCSFRLDIDFPDRNFEYIRLYSIHRTSIDAVPTVKIVEDIPINGDTVTYIDTGTKGDTIDPNQLLYVGGESIIANCITDKDRTLFLGNLSLITDYKFNDIKNLIKSNFSFEHYSTNINNTTDDGTGLYYNYSPDLSFKYSAGFKYLEKYRCGIQVQYSNGKWSSPIFLEDKVLCESPVWMGGIIRNSKSVKISKSNDSGNNSIQEQLLQLGVKRLRTCVVFPKSNERDIICQGILCPTVFRVIDRKAGVPYALSSWFFRPASESNDNESNVTKGASIEFKHNYALFTGNNYGAEVQNMLSGAPTINSLVATIGDYKSHIFVDENIVTFHSPDIEFDPNIQNLNFTDTNVELDIIGIAKLGSISGDIDIQTSSPTIGSNSEGFIHSTRGYKLGETYNINGGLVSLSAYRDLIVTKEFKPIESPFITWLTYPWHRSGSLNNDTKRSESEDSTKRNVRTAILSKKIISNLKFFSENESIYDDLTYNISTPQIFNSNELSVNKLNVLYLNSEITYYGNVDTLNIGEEYPIYGYNEVTGSSVSIPDTAISKSQDPVRIKYKSSPHMVFSLCNNTKNQKDSSKIQLLPRWYKLTDSILNEDTYTIPDWENKFSPEEEVTTENILYLYSNNTDVDFVVSAPTNQNGNIYAIRSGYLYKSVKKDNDDKYVWERPDVGTAMEPIMLKASNTHCVLCNNFLPGKNNVSDYTVVNGRRSTYKGSSVLYRIQTDTNRHIFKMELYGSSEGGTRPKVKSKASELTTNYTLLQDTFRTIDDDNNMPPYLLIGELRRTNNIDKFGGNSEEAKKNNLWVPAGRTYNLFESNNNSEGNIIVPFEYGDTWYSRYDCLKTYPFTKEDENQVVEIGSFMLETRVNIDGRYDRNRGQISNLNMSPQNFNLINDVYSQKDNFFNYRILDEDYYKQSSFVNQVTWSQEKHAGEDVDAWTHITLANTLDMDGSKGKVTALKSWNEYLMCFQEKALSQILFNSRTQIPVSDGVPIEISNGYKVDGSRLFTGTIGCNNKWSIINTTTGIYFADSNTNNLYLFNGQLTNLSQDRGMNWWTRENNVNALWKPIPYINNGLRTFYDTKYGDIYFTPGPKLGITLNPNDALCYSEQLGQFTSLMSYGDTQAMFNFADGFYSLRESDGNLKLYQNNVGEYNNFFGEYKGWDFSFISNDKPLVTKIFDTVELRADHYNTYQIKRLLYDCPVSFIKAQNEYQNGEANTPSGKAKIRNKNMMNKFRIWRGIIPRHNGTMQRIRNPWAMITLGWKPKSINDIAKELPSDATREKIDAEYHKYNTKEVMVHDVSVKYTI